MRRFKFISSSVALLMIATVFITSCSFGESTGCIHEYGQWEYKEATCTDMGGQTRICQKCGYRDGVTTPALGHTEILEIAGVEPSCTLAGSTEQKRCTVCNNVTQYQTVIPATGHSEVIDEAVAPTYENTGLTEGRHCAVCGAVIVAQETVPALEATYHSIVYQNIKTAASPDTTRYAEQIGLLELPVLEDVDGYRFVGWYTASQDGELVDYIPKGSTQDYVLFARWELIEYTITYVDAPAHSNAVKYTAEDEVVISDPSWDGLVFSHWTDGTDKTVIVKDSFGKDQIKIEKGTTGNVELKANWRLKENYVTPATSSDIIIVFDETQGTFHFIYKLGIIDQVKIETLQVIEKNLSSQEQNWSISETVTLSNTNTATVSETISQTITKTQQWQNSCAWQQANSISVNSQVSSNIGVECEGIKASIAATLGTSVMGSESRTDTTVEGGTIADGKQQSDSVTSSVSFVESSSVTVTETSKLMNEAPYGTYEYACVGTVHVFAVVTYDPESGNFYLNTYSVLDKTVKKAILYTPAANTQANIIPNEGLDYYIPGEELLENVHNAYYVRFNSNTPNSSESLMVAYTAGEDHSLYENRFARNGFEFTGWSLTANGGVAYAEQQSIKDIASVGEVLNLYAVWEPEQYTINWGSGVNSSIVVTRTSSPYKGASIGVLKDGSDIYYGDVLSITYTANSGYYFASNGMGATSIIVDDDVTSLDIFAKADPVKYFVKYDPNGGTGKMEDTNCTYGKSEALTNNSFTRHGWSFTSWNTKADGSGTSYSNGQFIENLSTTNGDTVTLYAQWTLELSLELKHTDFDVPWDEGREFSIKINDYFDYDELVKQGYKMSVSVSYTAQKISDDTTGFINNYLIINGLVVGQESKTGKGFTYSSVRTFGHFKSSQNISWNKSGIALTSNTLTFRFDSGNLDALLPTNVDCVPYGIRNLSIVIEFKK